MDSPLDFNNFIRLATGLISNASVTDASSAMLQSPQFMNTIENMTQQILQNIMVPQQDMHSTSTVQVYQQQEQPQKTKNLYFDLPVTLEDMYKGKTKKINVKRKRSYEQSDGSFKMVEEKNTLTVHIKRGMKNNEQIVFAQEADEIPGFDIGDVVIVLKEQPHSTFLRCDNDLFLNRNITISELYYFDTSITLLNGETIRIQNQKEDILSENNAIRKLSGYGMPIPSSTLFGDLFVQFSVVPRTKEFPECTQIRALFPPLNALSDETLDPYVMVLLDDKDYCKLDMFEDDEDLEMDEDGMDDEEDDEEEDDDEEDESCPVIPEGNEDIVDDDDSDDESSDDSDDEPVEV